MIEYSVIVPVYNGVDVLPRCLAALRRQSVEPSRYETIVVDDGSTDQTASAAEQRLEGHPHTRVVRIAHAGPAVARNAGARAAQGAVPADGCWHR